MLAHVSHAFIMRFMPGHVSNRGGFPQQTVGRIFKKHRDLIRNAMFDDVGRGLHGLVASLDFSQVLTPEVRQPVNVSPRPQGPP